MSNLKSGDRTENVVQHNANRQTNFSQLMVKIDGTFADMISPDTITDDTAIKMAEAVLEFFEQLKGCVTEADVASLQETMRSSYLVAEKPELGRLLSIASQMDPSMVRGITAASGRVVSGELSVNSDGRVNYNRGISRGQDDTHTIPGSATAHTPAPQAAPTAPQAPVQQQTVTTPVPTAPQAPVQQPTRSAAPAAAPTQPQRPPATTPAPTAPQAPVQDTATKRGWLGGKPKQPGSN